MRIKILSWNIQSFRSKKSELITFLQKNLFQIVLLQETWLNDKVTFTLPNYTCFRNDRDSLTQNPHGGVMICVHNSIANSISRTFSKKLPFLENIFVVLAIGPRIITVGSIYNSSALTPVQSRSDLESLLSLPGALVLGGDWNAKHTYWNNTANNRKGSDLLKICQDKFFDIHAPDSITLIPYRGEPSIVDFILSKGILGVEKPKVIEEGRSDHFPISFSLPFSVAMPAALKIKNFAKADWKKFRNTVATEIGSLHTLDLDPIDVRIEKLTEMIKKAEKLSIPIKNPTIFRYPSSVEIKDLISQRNRLRKSAISNPSLKSEVNRLNRLIKIKTANLNADSFNQKLTSLKIQDRSLFNFARAIKRKRIPLPPLLNEAKIPIYSDKGKAELLAKAFLKSHTLPHGDTSHTLEVENSIRTLDTSTFEVPNYELIKLKSLKDDIFRLKPRKTSGDPINNRLIKALPDNALNYLINIFNDCLRLGYFPSCWKIGKVIALPKPGKDPTLPENKRPITLLPGFGKLFEKQILSKLRSHEEDEKIFIPQQFGFRAQHSTVKQIIRVTEKVSLRFNENKSTALALLDLAKAFDSVWHDGIIHKLMIAKYPTFLVKIIRSFLSERFSYVVVNDSSSVKYLIPAGVPQGSSISPHLFNVFINDIPVPPKCKLALFADDAGLYSSIGNNSGSPNLALLRDKITYGLHDLDAFFTSWKMQLNESKTEAIIFSKSSKVLKIKNDLPIVFKNSTIKWSDSVRYLGGFLDSKLTYKCHVDTVIAKARKAIGILYCFLKKFSYVKTRFKVLMYKLYIRPIFTYAAPMLANCAKTHLNKLQIFQNKCLRMVLSAPYDTRITRLHEQASTPTVIEFIDKLTEKFYSSCEFSPNKLIRELGAYASDPTQITKHRLPRKQFSC